jgi:Na+-transporting methylmalonyl-CoA/oxaloacetate decarboxylase gamma subunit
MEIEWGYVFLLIILPLIVFITIIAALCRKSSDEKNERMMDEKLKEYEEKKNETQSE